ncbi:hypothetical protein BX616_002294 [Lobosporangium transversale]|uniref:Uncharacterized protein n=1 Tax=Lobosporangium transversale TaxID=64571 RepID=A0A1Y2GSF8_9FUNG|nr:hypothetical protein BCR41DRAFT_421462 [Lobosporangium transversale]KAF9901323.1 hypothetical protein BX616_002294 [Lobosporangium transversale]ORZ19290.1 hypothetical protein BCR41DRAFT_421462 [Lobosporangium transversale]|eukprot:XP_021882458.1 hypothetical protein BCR41DRAFT_421462 [Lobosporangium transversale]
MATDLEKYTEQATLPFSSSELGAFHRFHAYNWDGDEHFQAGLRTITQAQPLPPSLSELLKMKQYYFSTRLGTHINLDNYLSWRKHLEKPSDDPNVLIFKRFDEYDFDNDPRFQSGLPNIVSQLVKDGKSTLDKAALQKEMTKAKAFYYARFIELFDFPAYLNWKELEKSQDGPACPFAHLWQNKSEGSSSELAEDAQKFLTTTAPVSTGALQIHIHSPATKNVWTGVRLAKMNQAISDANDKDTITSILLTANSGAPTQDRRDPESLIVTKDEKWFSGGLVTSGSTEMQDKQDPAKFKELQRQYFSVVDQLTAINCHHHKPVVCVADGIVSLSAAYLAFGSGGQRVITENATLSFTPLKAIELPPNEALNPFAGLHLLAQIQTHAKSDSGARSLPKNIGHYLAFCPDNILRGPDLRKLGLADFFISSSKKNDIEKAVLSVAGCPPPHTVQAIRMALNAEVVYPGPPKIDVWRSEIKECFDDAASLDDVVTKLEKYNNNWSKSIREYIASLEPVFAKLLFEAITKASEMASFQERARLEYRLNVRYKDYLLSKDTTAEDDIKDLQVFFEPIEEEESELFTFPFTEWIKEHGNENEFTNTVKTNGNSIEEQDATQACPYLRSKTDGDRHTAMPSDHPTIITGAELNDPEAVKTCPFLSAKKSGQDSTASNSTGVGVPDDHPKIPGVDFSDAKAAEACPFLAAKKAQDDDEKKDLQPVTATTSPTTVTTAVSSTVPNDHPVIPGVDFSNPAAMASCPFLASQKTK